MAKRRPSKHLRPARPLSAGHAQLEAKADGDWVVRSVPGANAVKPYTCPGCHQQIPPGVAHLVAWPHEARGLFTASPLDERRHWHTACWRRQR